jgi:bacterioferritin
MKNAEINFLSSDLDVGKLIIMLNKAQNQEWLTYYQSWIGAILMEGPMHNEIKPELFFHSYEELNHALLIKSRMLQLGVTPNMKPSVSMKNPRCQIPNNLYTTAILNHKLTGEYQAINMYKEIADFTYKKDPTTHQLVTSILGEELTHVRDIEKWLDDISNIKYGSKNAKILNYAQLYH